MRVNDKVVGGSGKVRPDFIVRRDGSDVACDRVYCFVDGLWFCRLMKMVKDCAASQCAFVDLVDSNDDVSIEGERLQLGRV